jgi:hypothetical protein
LQAQPAPLPGTMRDQMVCIISAWLGCRDDIGWRRDVEAL